MKERDLQDYLYQNPEVLFPRAAVTEKAREYSIKGKRIDLLFVVDGIRYIVETKNVPIQREHIGQIVEYYGLMRHYMKDANLRMILVSSSIPVGRATYLEELGIRCVELPSVPPTTEEQGRLTRESRRHVRNVRERIESDSLIAEGEAMSFADMAGPVTGRSMAFARRMLRDTLEPVRKTFSEYELVPYCIKRAHSHDFDHEHDASSHHGTAGFTMGGSWWAYRFGYSRDLPPNDIPNVSIISNPVGIDVTVNAELRKSQAVMLSLIRKDASTFDSLLRVHGGLWLKTYLKLEHQPRFYHWVLVDLRAPGDFNAKFILDARARHERGFPQERERWIQTIIRENRNLTDATVHHLKTRNTEPNFALRLVVPLGKGSACWALQWNEQAAEIVRLVRNLKPFVRFFVRRNGE